MEGRSAYAEYALQLALVAEAACVEEEVFSSSGRLGKASRAEDLYQKLARLSLFEVVKALGQEPGSAPPTGRRSAGREWNIALAAVGRVVFGLKLRVPVPFVGEKEKNHYLGLLEIHKVTKTGAEAFFLKHEKDVMAHLAEGVVREEVPVIEEAKEDGEEQRPVITFLPAMGTFAAEEVGNEGDRGLIASVSGEALVGGSSASLEDVEGKRQDTAPAGMNRIPKGGRRWTFFSENGKFYKVPGRNAEFCDLLRDKDSEQDFQKGQVVKVGESLGVTVCVGRLSGVDAKPTVWYVLLEGKPATLVSDSGVLHRPAVNCHLLEGVVLGEGVLEAATKIFDAWKETAKSTLLEEEGKDTRKRESRHPDRLSPASSGTKRRKRLTGRQGGVESAHGISQELVGLLQDVSGRLSRLEAQQGHRDADDCYTHTGRTDRKRDRQVSTPSGEGPAIKLRVRGASRGAVLLDADVEYCD